MPQNTSQILMIEPIQFGYNAETALNNYFQQKTSLSSAQIQSLALAEFKAMVDLLQQHKINVISIKDAENPYTPDSIFPNNWVSFHSNGKVYLYPMYAPNRRAERRSDILEKLQNKGFQIKEIIDCTATENENKFLEGTGSMVLDRKNKIAYAAISERTDKTLFLNFCKKTNYKAITFEAFQTVNKKLEPIYHTNVMLCVADQYVVICLESIKDLKQRQTIIQHFEQFNKAIITISEAQMHQFAGNMLQVKNSLNEQFLVLSASAFASLSAKQIQQLETYNKLLVPAVPTIEKLGGGSVRCMMAEIFLSKK